MIWRIAACVALLVLGALIGCSNPSFHDEGSLSENPGVLATFSIGEISAEDIDRVILDLPEGQRPTGEEMSPERLEDLVRRLAAERLLLEQARSEDLRSDSRVVWEGQQARRQILVRAYLSRHLPGVEHPSEDDLRRAYKVDRDRYGREARRLVTHLFKRQRSGVDQDTIKEEVAELRQRVVAGESLALVAREHSDSESRHQDGNLGWISRGQLPAPVEAIVFNLEEAAPSQPIVTKEGVHLFLVEKIIESNLFSFDEVRDTIAHRWREERTRKAIEHLADELPEVKDLWVVDSEQVRPLVESGDSQALVMKAGDYEISVARFRQMIGDARGAADRNSNAEEVAIRLLNTLELHQRVHAAAVTEELDEDSVVKASIERAEEDALLRFARHDALRNMLEERSDLVEEYFRNNELRFATPLRLLLRRVQIPIEEGAANQVMSRLEEVVASHATEKALNSERLNDLATEFGSHVEEIGWMTIEEVA
ncbi:MAG: hypothetical protein GY906_02095, partial [bacterium]|nr:hypothetical protein [bacterium]